MSDTLLDAREKLRVNAENERLVARGYFVAGYACPICDQAQIDIGQQIYDCCFKLCDSCGEPVVMEDDFNCSNCKHCDSCCAVRLAVTVGARWTAMTFAAIASTARHAARVRLAIAVGARWTAMAFACPVISAIVAASA